MKRDGLAARLTLLAAFGLALILPREAMPCCQVGTCCSPTASAIPKDTCCHSEGSGNEKPDHRPPGHSDHDQSPLGGLGCGSPCCTKAPAPIREPMALLLDDSGRVPTVPPLQMPVQPDAGGVFHPPRS